MRKPLGSVSRLCLALIFAGATVALHAQEPDSAAGNRRGGRFGPEATREFLGLGPVPDEALAKKGAILFKDNCAACHGESGHGGQAPNLVRSVLVLHDQKDEEIGPVIKNGRAQAGMPAFPLLSADDIHNLCQFLKWQVELTANRGTYNDVYGGVKNRLSGDVKKGQAFFTENCVPCHSTSGDLAQIGKKFPQTTVMRSRFLWPASRKPAEVTVKTKSGETVTGTVMKLDDFDVALRDAENNYRYWPRSQVEIHVTDTLQGHRALLPKYSDANIHDLTAYLETLK